MDAWRLASGRYDPLSGEGARLFGGRWNSAGRPMVYASESLALAVLESLVHITGAFPADYHAFRIDIPEDELEILDSNLLKTGWVEDLGYTRAIGDQWFDQGRSLALMVPSAVIGASLNVLINPHHPRAWKIRVGHRESFRFDPRLAT